MSTPVTRPKLSERELGVVGIVRLNKRAWAREAAQKQRITYEWKPFGHLKISFLWQSSKCLWGRFGGGWQWKVGFQASRTCIIFNLLICSVRVSWYKEKEIT